MGPLKMDFLGGEAERRARRTTVLTAVVFALAVGLLAATGAWASFRASSLGTNVLEEVGNLPVIADIRRLAWGDSASPAIKDDQIRFLLLGVGGEGHAGSNLSDTILIVTADMVDKKIGIVSIPRDTAYPLGGGKFEKINAVHAYAEQDHPGQGAKETAKSFEQLFDTKINHVIRINFNGFKDFVDAVGGVDVNVERSFTDLEYPTPDDKWQTVSFEKGMQHMDGSRALIYARSRHGNNGEGGDFARNHRQQIVLLALKEKLMSKGTFTNPQKVLALYQAVQKNVQTDLSPWDLVKFAPLGQDFSSDKITMHVLTDAPDGELAAANVNGSFMLFPKDQDWSEIRAIIADPFKSKEERTASVRPAIPVRVEVRNGTYLTGLAGTVSDKLTKSGYQISGVGNAAFRGYERTVIFDLTSGKKPEELARLKRLLDANVSATLPSWVTNATSSKNGSIIGEGMTKETVSATGTDFLIVLGESTRDVIDKMGTP
jgi:LCP family protein required for cell wall assembly